MEKYLDILKQSLEEKIKLLMEISEYNERQAEVFRAEAVDISLFDQYIEEKEELIQKILKMDSAFESLYEKIAEPIKSQKHLYAGKIKILQALIGQVTELSVKVQAQEARNKALVEQYFAKQRKLLNQSRQRSAAAMSYYQSVSAGNVIDASVMDDKK